MTGRHASRHGTCAVLLVLLLLLSGGSVAAQHALVLSGGGARGLAHAGAVRGLDELGFQTPFVAGTSMGAIIGALHAAGYTPADIWDIVAHENWLERFAAEPIIVGPHRTPRRPLFSLGLGTRRLPDGALSTTGVERRLLELLFDAGVRARNDFDRLPRRFRAVTADLSTGAEVVLAGGSLPKAVRASMAVPGAFAPVPWDDGRILVDGGVANNLPVTVARLEAAGLPVVAVDALRVGEEVRGTTAVALGVRALRLLIENARPAAEPDVLVVPALATSETGFPTDARPLLEAGYRAVLEQVAVRPETSWAEALRPVGSAPERIGRLEVRGGSRAMNRLAERMFAEAVGRYDPSLVVARVRALHATGLFQAVWPHVEWRDGETGPGTMVVELQPLAATTVSGAAWWDNDEDAGAWASLRRRIDFITPFEITAGGRLSERTLLAVVDAASFSTALPGVIWTVGAHISRAEVRGTDDEARAAVTTRQGGWAGAELRGPGAGWHISLLVRADLVDDDAGGGWATGPSLRAGRSPSPDRVVGLDPSFRVDVRGGAVRYRMVQVRAGRDGEWGAVRAAAVAAADWSSEGSPADARPLTERELTAWERSGRAAGSERVAGGVDVAHRTVLDSWVRVRLRVTGLGWSDGAGGLWRAGGEAGVVRPTVAGPVEAGVAYGGGAGWRVNLGVGAAWR